jgi:Sigma-70 region 2
VKCGYNCLPNKTSHTSRGYSTCLTFLSSEEPLAHMRRGSQVSDFKLLLEEQIPRLRRYAIALTRKPDEADDLLQETLMRALTKAHLWQPGTDLRAWLFTMLHNQRVNSVRKAIRTGTAVNVEDVSGSIVATTDPTASRTLFELDRAWARSAKNIGKSSCSSVWRGCPTRKPPRFSMFPSARFARACRGVVTRYAARWASTESAG